MRPVLFISAMMLCLVACGGVESSKSEEIVQTIDTAPRSATESTSPR